MKTRINPLIRIFAAISVCSSSANAANWMQIIDGSAGKGYLDTASVRGSSGSYVIWLKYVPLGEATPVVTQYAVNCPSAQVTLITQTRYNEDGTTRGGILNRKDSANGSPSFLTHWVKRFNISSANN